MNYLNTSKRSRSKTEKISSAISKVGNLHPLLIERFTKELEDRDDLNNNVVKLVNYIKHDLKTPENGKNTQRYWKARGWSDEESYYKSKEFNKTQTKRPSPFSKEFWMEKINPSTGINFTEEEADFERNSIRPIRKEYWMKQGFSEDDAIIKAKETKDSNDNNNISTKLNRTSLSPRCKEYWMLRGFSEEEAIEKVSESQRTFSLDICIEKFGEEEGRKRWVKRQEKWYENFNTNFSLISQELFWELIKGREDLEFIFFAQLSPEKTLDDSGINHEYKLVLDSLILPDFLDLKFKKIIEFDGTYWHGKVGRGNKNRDTKRDKILNNFGFQVLHIREQDFTKNREETVIKCLNFLST